MRNVLASPLIVNYEWKIIAVLKRELKDQGNWLFRWRSYIPVLMFPLLVLTLLVERGYIPASFQVAQSFYIPFCLVISFVGLAIRAGVIGYVPVGTSGRNTTEQRARYLNTTGMYGMVRHPLYLGNFLIYLGIVMSVPVWWFILLFALLFFIYYERIMYAEEAYLFGLYGKDYESWAAKTPAFLPRLSGWEKPTLPFSIKNVLKREYPGFFATIVSFTAIEVMQNFLGKNEPLLSPNWITFFLGGAAIYLTLRTIKKKTRFLHVEGR